VPDYLRNRVPGGTFFFTANLLDRRSDLLVTQIDALREAVRRVRDRGRRKALRFSALRLLRLFGAPVQAR
jgi:REP element-mobilizing transposase RayT